MDTELAWGKGSQLNLHKTEYICLSLDKNDFPVLSVIYNS